MGVPDFQPSLTSSLTPTQYQQLANLLETAATQGADSAMVLTQNQIPVSSPKAFVVVISEQFKALLIGHPEVSQGAAESYSVQLSFEPAAIATFGRHLLEHAPEHPLATELLAQAMALPHPNHPQRQTEFTQGLIKILSPPQISASEGLYPAVSVCQPIETALQQQIEQERVLNQVIRQIHQSLELPIILETAVEQARQFLQVERLVIYQFGVQPTTVEPTLALESVFEDKPGCATYEALAAETVLSVLGWGRVCEQDPRCLQQYNQGLPLAVADVEAVYPQSSDLLRQLRQIYVRAKLVVPLLVQQQLWGLLIAHQCSEPRQWQGREQAFLQHIAEHLAIAIHQAQLYAQLQQQKQTLEGQVIERTQDLRDTLVTAQSANRAKSDFLATMSHELRTPLTCVIGMSATLLRWSFGPLTEKQRSYLETIHDSGEHLLELINDILDLSQVEAGKAILNVSEFSLARLGHQTLQLLKDKATAGEIALKLDLQVPPEDDHFTADLRRVKQILFNLVANAIKFTPPGGQVVLRVSAELDSAIFQVKDTGIGIPKSQLPLLFQKFQQLDPSYQRRYEGSGLGLALTKQLTELHGGTINVSSIEGKGSIFTVSLPAQPITAKPYPPSKRQVPAYPLATDKILLIEDHEESAILICDILTTAGYQMVWMVDGSAALEQIRLLQPIALITDIQLSGIDGYQLIQTLRHHQATKLLKILVLTAKAMPADRQQCLAVGADDYLAKPIKPDQLLQKLAALLDTSSDAAPRI